MNLSPIFIRLEAGSHAMPINSKAMSLHKLHWGIGLVFNMHGMVIKTDRRKPHYYNHYKHS